MKKAESPRDAYMRHIAHANHIIFNNILNNLNSNNNEQQ